MSGEAEGPGECDTEEDREQVLASLLEATRELMVAGDADAIAQVAVDAASERLGYELVGVHLVRDAPRTEYDGLDVAAAADGAVDADAGTSEPALVPVAWTEELVDLIGRTPPPTIGPGSGVGWESFEQGELRVFDDLRAEDARLVNPETAFRSELHVPLGRHGLLIVGSAAVSEFDAEDVSFARILAANTTAALDNLAARRAVERREQELARQNRRLEEFADVISHDLRNPLSVAKARLELGLETGDRAEFEQVGDALDRIESLVAGLLALAKEGRAVGETTVVDVAAVAERAWESVDTRGATLETTPVPGVRADASRLRQLLENLFRNSVEHGTDDPADLTVTVEPLADGPGFAVADDGVGIPASELDAVFEHGASQTGGTGLGLAIVRTIAEAHGWTVEATVGEDGGARFRFRTGGERA